LSGAGDGPVSHNGVEHHQQVQINRT